jgi:hypothetical protein
MRLWAEPSVREATASDPEARVDGVDLKRVLTDEGRLQREDLFFDSDARTAVGFGDSIHAIIGSDLDEGVSAVALHQHYLHIFDFDFADWSCGQRQGGQ